MPFDVAQAKRLRPQNEIVYFPTISSTMTEASRLASEGAAHGTVVVADEQTAGVGRLGRSWQSPAGDGLYSSTVLRLPTVALNLPSITLALGLATASAIQESAQLSCDLRWPNDVLINGKKVAGILAHLDADAVIAGIGINVNQLQFPDDLRTPATSLRLELGGNAPERELLLCRLLEALDTFSALIAAGRREDVLRAFAASSSYALGRRVIVEESGQAGVTAGLDNDGFLLVRFDDGVTRRIIAGGIRPVQ